MTDMTVKICDFCGERIFEYKASGRDIKRIPYYQGRGRNYEHLSLHRECFEETQQLLAKLSIFDAFEIVNKDE